MAEAFEKANPTAEDVIPLLQQLKADIVPAPAPSGEEGTIAPSLVVTQNKQIYRTFFVIQVQASG